MVPGYASGTQGLQTVGSTTLLQAAIERGELLITSYINMSTMNTMMINITKKTLGFKGYVSKFYYFKYIIFVE